MKNILYIFLFSLFVYSCGTTKDRQMTHNDANSDTLQIANDSLDFDLVVFEPGFDIWLLRQLPMEAYNLKYLESMNQRYINEYNRRAMTPSVYGHLYPQPINYDRSQEYGIKLNYMLFMYFNFFQEEYNQRL